jgi:DNA-binding response OmpR family regulator
MNGDQRPQVLIVDDNDDIRTILGINLGLAGLGYAEATDGMQALSMLRANDYDACILDLTMPGVSGFEVLRQLARGGRIDTPAVIVLSARGGPADALEALNLGAHAHLTKPFSPSDLTELVRMLVNLAPQQRQQRRLKAMERASSLDRYGARSI